MMPRRDAKAASVRTAPATFAFDARQPQARDQETGNGARTMTDQSGTADSTSIMRPEDLLSRLDRMIAGTSVMPFTTSMYLEVMRSCADFIRASLQPATPTAGWITDRDLYDASCLTRVQLKNWTDDDFAKHVTGIRRTLEFLFARLDAPATGGDAVAGDAICCKGLAPIAECRCEIERKAAGHPPYQRSPDVADDVQAATAREPDGWRWKPLGGEWRYAGSDAAFPDGAGILQPLYTDVAQPSPIPRDPTPAMIAASDIRDDEYYVTDPAAFVTEIWQAMWDASISSTNRQTRPKIWPPSDPTYCNLDAVAFCKHATRQCDDCPITRPPLCTPSAEEK
jgi:hypothetical protein